MELDIIAAKDFIAGKFRNAGDFDFIPDEQLEEIISALVAIDDEYLRKIAEDDSPYDEEYVYEHMLKSVSSKFSRYQDLSDAPCGRLYGFHGAIPCVH